MSLAMRSEASSQRHGSSLVIKTRLTMLACLFATPLCLRTTTNTCELFTFLHEGRTEFDAGRQLASRGLSDGHA
ncbi:hypothetical protein CC79DRAFT_1333581 [Sarocladium strictum]